MKVGIVGQGFVGSAVFEGFKKHFNVETFDLNTNENITDVTASTTNDLVIKLTLASTSTIVYGATVTIASV